MVSVSLAWQTRRGKLDAFVCQANVARDRVCHRTYVPTFPSSLAMATPCGSTGNVAGALGKKLWQTPGKSTGKVYP
jgi:hypothetical protein